MTLPTPFYDADGITIYHGDCREIAPHLGKFDLLLTDPPYGISYASNPLPVCGNGVRTVKHKPAGWDAKAPTEDELQCLIKCAPRAIIWGGDYFRLPASPWWITWWKPDAPPSMGNIEFAWTNIDGAIGQITHSIAATNPERCGHPTQKPMRVIQWALSKAPRCQSVLDPFMGSGTTLVAAKLRGMRAVGIELEESYCKIAVERLRQGVLIAV